MRVRVFVASGVHARPPRAARRAAQARFELHRAAADRAGGGDELARGHVGGALAAGLQRSACLNITISATLKAAITTVVMLSSPSSGRPGGLEGRLDLSLGWCGDG